MRKKCRTSRPPVVRRSVGIPREIYEKILEITAQRIRSQKRAVAVEHVILDLIKIGLDHYSEPDPDSIQDPDLNPIPPDAWYVLGVLRGDGCFLDSDENGWMLKLKVSDFEFAKEFHDALTRLGFYNHFWHGNDGYYHVVAQGSQLEWFVPLCFYGYRELQSMGLDSEENLRRFLRGIYDSDGGLNTKQHLLHITNTDPELIHFCLESLSKLGFNPKVFSRDPGGNRSRYYRIEITGIDQINKFISEIGSSIPRKRMMIQRKIPASKPWTPSELEFLRANYSKMRAREIAGILGRTERAVIRKAWLLGLVSRPWLKRS